MDKFQRNAITPEQLKIQHFKAFYLLLEMEKEILKQAAVLMSEAQKIIALIIRLKAKWSVWVLCHLFGIYRSIY